MSPGGLQHLCMVWFTSISPFSPPPVILISWGHPHISFCHSPVISSPFCFIVEQPAFLDTAPFKYGCLNNQVFSQAVCSTVITRQYTVQSGVTNPKLRCRSYSNNDHVQVRYGRPHAPHALTYEVDHTIALLFPTLLLDHPPTLPFSLLPTDPTALTPSHWPNCTHS